jgi:tyrosyl-tRNA synthetase
MSDFPGSAESLSRNAVEILPEGELADRLAEGRPLRVKLGIDPTAPDIHLGHTVVLGKLREFQDAGHTVVLIIGDFTARVGDPSGRSAQRPMLEPAQIDANAATFQEQAFKVLDRDRTEVRFNSEWLRMEPEELFRLMSRATVARLLEREDFSRRMAEQAPISVLELLYPLLQGYDSVAVEADIELGGTDQKFNLLFGRDMQVAYGQRPQLVMTLPILPGTDGVRRMSKSTGNYVGVTEAPGEMFGKVMSVPDEVMPHYFELVLGRKAPEWLAEEPARAKRLLAAEIVDRFHGEGAGRGAEEEFDRVFVRHELPEEVEEAVVDLSAEQVHLPAILAEAFGVSRGEVRRLIAQGGVKLEGEAMPGDVLDVPSASLSGKVVSLGKRRHRRLRSG